MAKMDTTFDQQELAKSIWVDVTIKSSRLYDLRLRLGVQLMRLGQMIAGIGAVKVRYEGDD